MQTSPQNIDYKQKKILKSVQENKNTPQIQNHSIEDDKLNIKKYALHSKDINEAIGAMQTIKKTLSQIKNKILEAQRADMFQSIYIDIINLANKCSFLGDKLFGKDILINTNTKAYSLHITNYENFPLNTQKDIEDIKEYTDANINKIDNILQEINHSLSKEANKIIGNAKDNSFDNFDKDIFKSLMR